MDFIMFDKVDSKYYRGILLAGYIVPHEFCHKLEEMTRLYIVYTYYLHKIYMHFYLVNKIRFVLLSAAAEGSLCHLRLEGEKV